MKKIILLAIAAGLALSGCGQSELDRLNADLKNREKLSIENKKIEEKLQPQCAEATKKYQEAQAMKSSNTESLRVSGENICTELYDALNNELENRRQIFNLQVAIIAEKNSQEGE